MTDMRKEFLELVELVKKPLEWLETIATMIAFPFIMWVRGEPQVVPVKDDVPGAIKRSRREL